MVALEKRFLLKEKVKVITVALKKRFLLKEKSESYHGGAGKKISVERKSESYHLRAESDAESLVKLSTDVLSLDFWN